jgi:rSAM/selenodomain-associated transferase 1
MLKAPRIGLVKTRLAREIGAESAAIVYRRLAEHQIACLPRDWALEIHFAPLDAETEMRNWLGAAHSYHPQLGHDLGDRLIHATAAAFARGAGAVIVIGGDCPGLDEALLREAAHSLQSADVVIGPALDGGYYLIGLRRPEPALFAGIPWSTPGVFDATIDRIRQRGLSQVTLPAREDVDDLPSWHRRQSLLPAVARFESSGPGDRPPGAESPA